MILRLGSVWLCQAVCQCGQEDDMQMPKLLQEMPKGLNNGFILSQPFQKGSKHLNVEGYSNKALSPNAESPNINDIHYGI